MSGLGGGPFAPQPLAPPLTPEFSQVLREVEGQRCAILLALTATPDAPTDYIVILASEEPGAKFRTARCFWGRNDNAFRDAAAYYESGAQRARAAGVRP